MQITEAPRPQPETDRQPQECAEPGPVQRETCANCGTGLLGPHCYACGQPVQGMVRHFSSIVGDLFDTLLALDSRIARTLWPLLSKPGFLTREYLAGRRVRYVSPVRLFIFLCLTAFFTAQISSDWSDIDASDSEISRAATPAEVERLRDATLADLAEARRASADVPGVGVGLKEAERRVRREAELRLAQLSGRQMHGETPPAAALRTGNNCLTIIRDECWNAQTDPIHIGVFPQAVNDWLTVQAVRAAKNIQVLKADPNRFKKAVFSAIPSALFVMLPFFALLLWLFYPLKRRLYMEHLIVALHSHAFLCLALLVSILLGSLRAGAGPGNVVATICDTTTAILLLWMPLYLLLMQKRIYGQGWPMTLAKYLFLSGCYVVLLSVAVPLTMVVSLIRL